MRRLLRASALGVGLPVVSCFELSAPASGLSAISTIALAWPSVVVGDVLRDENGDPAPLRVDAYDGAGNLVTDATVSFIVLDPGLRVDADGVVRGETARDTPTRVVALVRRGDDALQTPEARIDVVLRPDSVTPGQDTTFAQKTIPRFDPAPIPSEPLAVKVLNRATKTPIRSWIVRYEILEPQPPGVNGQKTVVFPGAGTSTVTFDTTDASGLASRTVSLQRALLLNGDEPHDVRVRATVRRAGTGATDHTITFTLPFVPPPPGSQLAGQ